ncbi:MAG: alpha/beta fold hydrolase [Paracoccaceae bacterium]
MSQTLVFLPGFMCDRRLFAPQIAHFGEDVECITKIVAKSTIGQMADAVLATAPERFALAGLSMGGIIALEIMARAPSRVTRLALMDTTPMADAPANRDIRNRQIEDVHKGRLDTVMRDELKPAYLVDGPGKPAILETCMEMARTLGPDVFEQQSLALRDRLGLEDVLPTITVPTLVLCGAQDRLCPPERHRAMNAAIAHSKLKLISGAGHLPTLEQPEATSAALAAWLGA